MDVRSIKEFLKDMLKYIIIIVVILFIISYITNVTKVVGSSMSPNLKDGDMLIMNKFSKDIKREDIIALKYADTKYLIKRVIGLPGENIEIINNKLYINGNLYIEEYISDKLDYQDFKLSSLGITKIPEDEYLVLGDNRVNSLDSRKIGLIKKKDIIGKIKFRIWPINKLKFF